MGAIGYYIALPFIYGIAVLPFPLLYLLSDGLYLLLYTMIGYRTAVVRENLRKSFPEKSAAELRRIERAFYRWFCDLVLETLKTLTISPEQVKERVSVTGEEVLKKYFAERRSIILVMGHWGNWELGGARFSQLPWHKLYVIYHPLENPLFDGLMARMRTRLGNGLYPMKEAARLMVRDRHAVTATAFIADQTPSPHNAWWTTFLNQPTPVFRGTGALAKRLDRPVVYVGMDRPRRGHYTMRFEDLLPEPARMEEEAINQAHVQRLEQDIRRRPAIWLWTHRRWKHRPPPNFSDPG